MNEEYPLALPLGTVLAGQYEINGILGQGGFGITYCAYDHRMGGRVAVKEFFPDSLAARTGGTSVSAFSGDRTESFEYGKSCFLKEAETLAQFIGNENIVRVISYFEENGTAYFVMEFIEGLSFDDYIKQRGGSIGFEEASRVLVPIMEALQQVHSQGIIHRDVTPDNIFITRDGIPKLIDFGAARYSLGDKSQSLDVVLKHGFAPKEQYTRRGRQGPYTDVYSIGASFYYAVTGKRPPDAIERMDEDNLIAPSARGVHIPYEAEEAILKALSLQPAERFQSMEEFERALLGPKTLSKKTPAEAERTPRSYRRDEKKQGGLIVPLIVGVAAVVFIVLLVLAIRFVSSVIKDRTDASAETETVEAVSEEESSSDDVEAEDTEDDSNTDNASAEETVEETETDYGVEENWPEIIGNTPDNLVNNSHFDPDGGYILPDYGTNSCLSTIGDITYYLRATENGDRMVYAFSQTTNEDAPVPELERFKYVERLLVSDEFFYLYIRDEGSYYCVRRSDGSIKGSRPVDDPRACAFRDGFFFYVGENSVGGPSVYMVPAGDLNAEPHEISSFWSKEKISTLCAADNGVVYRARGEQLFLGIVEIEGDQYKERHYTDFTYHDGNIWELVADGDDIFFVAQTAEDSWDIGRFNTSSDKTTILTSVPSKIHPCIGIYYKDGQRRIDYYYEPVSEADGSPCFILMDDEGSVLKTIDLS